MPLPLLDRAPARRSACFVFAELVCYHKPTEEEWGTIMSDTHKGQCFCGAVEIEVKGEPAGMGYCHCESCRAWSAGPVNAFTLWDPDKVKVVKGQEHIKQYNKTENSGRKWCDKCGGHLMAGHPGLGLTDVYAAIIPGVEFKPGIHVNYAETVLPMKDGLPKMKDFPSEFGGSGETIPE